MRVFLLSLFFAMSLAGEPCSSNVLDMLSDGRANGTDPTQVLCNNGVWDIPGDLIVNSDKLIINNDTLNIGGALSFSSSAALYLQFFTNETLGTSGFLNIGTTVDWGGALLEAEILYPAGLGAFKYVFASFPPGQPPTLFKFGEFILPTQQRFCRKQVDGTTLSFPGGTGAALSSVLGGSEEGCESNKDRQWVLALLIIAGIWALALLLFALVTCKFSSSLKAKFWESDYARA